MSIAPLLDRMRARARAVQTRALVRRWKYRQRNLAAGVWFQIRRVLADANEAYVISDADARRLLAEGYKPEACGARLEPEKTIIFVDSMRLGQLDSRRIPVRLGPDFLLATSVALVPFDSTSPSGGNGGQGRKWGTERSFKAILRSGSESALDPSSSYPESVTRILRRPRRKTTR